jgi:Ca2+-binding RTX toxin-like protein
VLAFLNNGGVKGRSIACPQCYGKGVGMRKSVLLLASSVLAVLAVSGMAWAATIDCGDASTVFCRGTDGSDTIYGTNGQDAINAREGADKVYGRAGNDVELEVGGGSTATMVATSSAAVAATTTPSAVAAPTGFSVALATTT